MTTQPETKPSEQTAPRSAAYELAHEPDGRSWTVRENLTNIIERELLGPAHGPNELLDGPPDVAYLVGRIAPVRLTGKSDDPTEEGAAEAPTDVGDAVDANEGRGIPMTSVDDSSATADEDEAEDTPQKRGLMIPASMGLRFQVPADLPAFFVVSSWGVYEPVRVEGEESARARKFQRTPIDIPVEVLLADLAEGETKEYPLKDDVKLRVDCYDDRDRGACIIEVALCNDRETPPKIPVNAWLYQTKLQVTAGAEAVFLPVQDVTEPPIDGRAERDDELRMLNLQYRNRLEFAIGRTCSVDWDVENAARRARSVWTTWLPQSETPQTTAEEIEDALLDMTVLATAEPERLRAGLSPIVAGYADWLAGEKEKVGGLPEHLREDGDEAVAVAGLVQKQLAAGLDHLLSDDEALRCFRFMNRVMADQRVQTQVAEMRARNPRLSVVEAHAAVLARGPLAHSWRTFQLAFILMQLPLLTDPTAQKRSSDLATAQLLFFPTGGGKTEAYLGLAAYTFAIRRRQGVRESASGPLNGLDGVSVLMRYTLRLLTSQQFQRATALVCAAEMARRDDPSTWGTEPFRIGLWVGTDVSPKRYHEAAVQLAKVNAGQGYRLTVLQIQRCPWCGTRIGSRNVRGDDGTRRIHVYCGDEFGDCPFAEGGSIDEGLPVLTTDEEIYRLTPAFVIATVDKFARLAREGEAASLFGFVSRRCERHGYVHPDYTECDVKEKHPAKGGLPAAHVRSVGRLRPPDLIIQDELHLISGALGTTVGLFEVAIDVMASWVTAQGAPVRPLVVASTATVRNAAEQIRSLYGRDVTIFPPQVLDVGRTFFSKEQEVSEDAPGRRYLGISTTGVRLTTAEIRIAEVLMSAAQLMMDRDGAAADPYMTMVGYFNATRELAGMTRYMADDVQTALSKGRPWSKLPRRTGTEFGSLNMAELTARVSSADITTTLDQMAATFDPAFDSAEARRNMRTLIDEGKPLPKREVNPFDAVLATSMLQVGVDVTRLGLMMVVGQPKNTAEYIQASSRVGRDPARPGLVVSLGNWARPRDLAHFESFRQYHETFYKQVEALSVTPFSLTSMERGLEGVLVSVARVTDGVLSPEKAAGRVKDEKGKLDELVEALVARVLRASNEATQDWARQRLINRVDQWAKRRDYLAGQAKNLSYERVHDPAQFGPLMISAENARSQPDLKDMPPFRVANSMREVQPEINLLVSPIPERLYVAEPAGAPKWNLPKGGD
ncbi:DISARM system helicase DrmA [Intrasporangium calvum]|uniref:Helicase domain protein n=1 Tax=Intrasporangium calvum (strain ATCC 23552 / DSM 43043 / JCM 3097 / NBRC 12989 / NCIMB 10167 / NRRL B-3866 / 7 KIP) TaxID=710696 RepID=E6SC30_INTC7|nr:DISARM system helicase DrmA [Intrasporangium calvum]ADU49570.1 helicase domain protein [Intrasporangium calvum DSM 43043]